ALADSEHPNVHHVAHQWQVAADYPHLAQDGKRAKPLLLGVAPPRSGPPTPRCSCLALRRVGLRLGRRARGGLGCLLTCLLALLLPLELLAAALVLGLAQRVPQVTKDRPCGVLELAPSKAQLNGLVAIGRRCLDLCHRAGAGLNHRNWNRRACGAEDLRHAYLAAQ